MCHLNGSFVICRQLSEVAVLNLKRSSQSFGENLHVFLDSPNLTFHCFVGKQSDTRGFLFLQRDGCPKIVNLGSAKTDLFYERKKYGFKKR